MRRGSITGGNKRDGGEGIAVDDQGQVYLSSFSYSNDFPVNDADVEFSGASSGTINLSGRLDADISGASRLYYIGEPTMGNINTSGASSLSKR